VDNTSAVTRLFAQPGASERLDADAIVAFQEACETQLGPVFAYVRYRVDTTQAAEELTSAAFLKALERLHSFDRRRGDMRQWIFAIARHLVTDHLRAHRRWILVPIEWLGARGSLAPTPEQAVVHAETQRSLVQAIERLRRRDRDLLGMRFGAGLTNREIAEVTGLTERHVAVVIQRALAHLRACLESQGVTHV
jgi:RNA polymerase sigma factor (sigma-70 family)